MAETFEISSASFKYVVAAFFVGFIFISLFGGFISHLGSAKLFVLIGGVIAVVCLVWIGYVNSFQGLILLMCLMGVGGGLIEIFSTAAVAELYYPDNRRMLNFSQVFFCLGAIIMPLVSSFLIKNHVSYRVSFISAAFVSLLVVIYLSLCRYQHPQINNTENRDSAVSKLFKSLVFYLLGLGMFLYVTAEIGVSAWICAYFEKGLHVSRAFAANMLALYWFGMLLGRMGCFLVHIPISDSAYIRNTLILAGIGIFGLVFVRQPAIAAACAFLFALGEGAVWPTIMSCASKRFPAQAHKAIGCIAAAGGTGAAVGPYIMGVLVGKYEYQPQIMLLPAGIVVVNIIIFSIILNTTGKKRYNVSL